MKLWEAMLEGYKKVGRQAFGMMSEGNVFRPSAVCAMGAAGLIMYGFVCYPVAGNPADINALPCPVCGHLSSPSHSSTIPHLNDHHHWTIPEIAAWVREQEEGIAAKEPELQEVAQ
jgi:hypothetical protein